MLGFAMSRRVFLQDLDSHYFLSEDNTWVKTCQQARVFPHTYLGLLEGLQHTERRTQVLWCLTSPRLIFMCSCAITTMSAPNLAQRVLSCSVVLSPYGLRALRHHERPAGDRVGQGGRGG